MSNLSAAAVDASAKPNLGVLPTWNLGDLYPAMDSPVLKGDLEVAESEATAFQLRGRGRLAEDAAPPGGGRRVDAIRAYEGLEDRLGRLISYAGLVYAGDTSSPANAKFYGDIQARVTDISARLLFFGLELNRIEDAAIEAALAGNPQLAHYRPWLADLRLERPFQLEDRIEELFLEKAVTGPASWNRLFDETMTGLRFAVRGEELSIEETLNLLQEDDKALRQEAAEALAAVFGANLRLFSLITNTLAKDKEISDRWRGFTDIADSRHLANRVERDVVDALAAAVREAYPSISHRYYRLKAGWLGQEALDHWDRNAPLPGMERRPIGWDEARETVMSAYAGFSPRMAEIAGRFFDKSWIDAGVRPGKSPGAFAHPTVPSAHPYVLLNYLGKPRDVMTLAHELGHGVHQVLAARQGPLMAPTPLTLAETASVFGEMLTFRSLLEKTPDPQQRRFLIASKVEDMINTVIRQIAFYNFERALHTERRQGELTSERIGQLWVETQGESLGPSVRLQPGYETFWAYIPHFIHSPFYVYAYAFGDCLVNSLYAVYVQSDAGFAERYLEMLEAGGTKHHSELLAPFGLDATDPGFWHRGLSVISGLIDELEALEA